MPRSTGARPPDDAGYCVDALNYGETAQSSGRFFGLGPIATSAKQLAAFVDKFLARSEEKKVDIVGHSQGGMMPRYYIRLLGGVVRLNMLVGLAPSNHGAHTDGMEALIKAYESLGIGTLSTNSCPSRDEKLVGRRFLATRNAGGDTTPGVK